MPVTSLPAADPLALLPHYDSAPREVVRAGMVLSLDGVAAVDGSSRPLSTAADRAVFRALRAVCDVVLVGAGTARTESYGPVPLAAELVAWRRARGLPDRPRLAVVTRSGDLDAGGPLLAGEPPLVLTTSRGAARLAPLADRTEVVVVGEDDVDLPALLTELRERGLAHVLCEGGPSLLGALVAARVVDELCCTVVPALVGDGPRLLPPVPGGPVPLRLLHLIEVEGSLLLRYALGR